jgi:hypothetical protein
MALNANDFGCLPQGRFLHQVSIDAGSTVLTDIGGVLRMEDVGKRIAIPGAADLVAKVARLVGSREVKEAKILADSKKLVGTLLYLNEKNEEVIEPFDANVHQGWRITIVGAGPNGKTLVTDIAHVRGNNEIELVASASNSVSGTKVILSKGDRVSLDDYARRSISDVPIMLHDRTAQGTMIVGGRMLVSEDARFSSEDIETSVTIRDAGLLVTTIQTFTSTTQVTLVTPAPRTVDQGQADVWMHAREADSRSGWEKLLAHIDANGITSAEIQFGPGIYDFTRTEDVSGPLNAAIGLFERRNLTIIGMGPRETVLRLFPQQDLGTLTTHVIETIKCRNITFRDLSIYGAYLTLRKSNEQMHGLTLNEGSENINIEKVRVFQTGGDGIRFLGRAENPETGALERKVRNIKIENCQLIQNKRSGFAIQREVDNLSIRNCYIEMVPPSTDSCVDMEPTGGGENSEKIVSPTNITIDSCSMLHRTTAPAVSISGFSGLDPARNIKFVNNQINGGSVFCSDVQELQIQNNTIRSTPLGTTQKIPIYLAQGCVDIVIKNNNLINEDAETKSVILMLGKREPKCVTVANNNCFTLAGTGIQCLSGRGITIQANRITATSDCNCGIKIRSQTSDMDQIVVQTNTISIQETGHWRFGILLDSRPHNLTELDVTGNTIDGANKDIEFLGTNF